MDPPAGIPHRAPHLDTSAGPDDNDRALAEFVKDYPKLFVLTGAGCSTAAGLGDYRDAAGQWKRKQPITGQVFRGDEYMRRRYWARSAVGWPAFDRAQPTTAHRALASLQRQGRAAHLVTQNVDLLHQKAGHTDVIDLHGRLAEVACLGCGAQESRNDFQQRLIDDNPWLSELSADYAPDGDADLETDQLDQLLVPNCLVCDGMMKPEVVFFGENVPRPRVELAISRVDASDAVLVAGSSLMVFSGFRFCRRAAENGQPVIIVNDGVTRADELASLKIAGDVGIRLSRLSAALSPRAAD